ncbi:MAG: YlxM family DNA-binding protein [Lachnospiraceae bacterium]|nr:YlxM family DNA-binding protein [Lachnospiraceae bacterium]
MEKIVEQGLLYDFYGELLTKHQQQIYEGVVYDNLSLGEIAQEEGISRQAVHDIVKRCDKILLSYEEKLQLVAKFASIKDKVSQINRLSMLYEQDELEDRSIYSSQVRKLSAEILQEL